MHILKANLGLAHAYSRHNVEFDVNRQDKPIIQAIAIVEQMDKNQNQFAMRIKEWFSWHVIYLKINYKNFIKIKKKY